METPEELFRRIKWWVAATGEFPSAMQADALQWIIAGRLNPASVKAAMS